MSDRHIVNCNNSIENGELKPSMSVVGDSPDFAACVLEQHPSFFKTEYRVSFRTYDQGQKTDETKDKGRRQVYFISLACSSSVYQPPGMGSPRSRGRDKTQPTNQAAKSGLEATRELTEWLGLLRLSEQPNG